MKVEVKLYDKELHYEQVVNMVLKEEDRIEVEAASGTSAKQVLELTVNMYGSYTYVIEYEGKIEGIFGAAPSGYDGVGIGFFLTTNEIKNFWYEVGKYSIDAILIMFEKFDRITNFVTVRHKVSVRWLKRLGARFDDTVYILEDPDEEFYRFDFCKEDYI